MPADNMQVVFQPPGSKCCGQSCVAMFLGTSLEHAIQIVGHDHATRYAELRDALRSYGVTCPDRLALIPMTGCELPDVCLLRIYWGERWQGTHWMIKNGDATYCSSFGLGVFSECPMPTEFAKRKKKVRITSFAEIQIPELLL